MGLLPEPCRVRALFDCAKRLILFDPIKGSNTNECRAYDYVSIIPEECP